MFANYKKGVIFALLAATISGFSIFYNKLVLIKGIDPLIFNILKNGGAALLLSALLFFTYRSHFKEALKKHWPKLLLIGFVGGSLPFFLFFEGLRQSSAINATLIQKTLFVWTALLAIPLLGERLSKWQIIGYLCVVYANLFIGGFAGLKLNTTELMILSATILWGIEVVLARVFLKHTNAMLLAWGRMTFGVVFLFGFAFFQNKIPLLLQIKPEQLMLIAGSIAFLTVYISFYFSGLKYAPATLVTALLVLATPLTNILSALFITSTLAQPQILSLVITIIGVGMLLLFAPRKSQTTTTETPVSA